MDGNFVGLAAVVMIFGIPMAAMYTFFRVRKLRSEERWRRSPEVRTCPCKRNSRKRHVRGGREFCWWPGRWVIS
jgi:hypothetical protein